MPSQPSRQPRRKSNRPEVFEALREVPLFEGVPEDSVVQVADGSLLREVKPERLVFRAGEEAQALYVVRSGALEVSVRDADGRQRVARLGPGDVFGEAALLADRSHGSEVKALEPCELLVIPKAVVVDFLDRHPSRRLRLRTLTVTRHLSNAAAAFVPQGD